ncbi:hypothetical protein KS4_07680 [Poriferisphaera corsica]|uniref:Uncharacterized protein n=1 Tax=Poriferisphaera corsica TaxID=2528020 RepID=A0A517YR94_9BACT|nr:hypothetical protein [Poriferisphaera corsica]QDU32734.1 hypothetical protein KS4_07680 [Poriferisphaera corsica]
MHMSVGNYVALVWVVFLSWGVVGCVAGGGGEMDDEDVKKDEQRSDDEVSQQDEDGDDITMSEFDAEEERGVGRDNAGEEAESDWNAQMAVDDGEMEESGEAVMVRETDEQRAKREAWGNENTKQMKKMKGFGQLEYGKLRGQIQGGEYESPDRVFKVREPMLVGPNESVLDYYNEDLGMWVVKFSDYDGRFYTVMWGMPEGLNLDDRLSHEDQAWAVHAWFVKQADEEDDGEVKVLDAYYDAMIANGGVVSLDYWEKRSAVLRSWEEDHPDRAGEKVKKYERLDRYFGAFTTVYRGRVVRLEVDDRANMFEEDHAKLGGEQGLWTKERRVYLMNEILDWSKSLKLNPGALELETVESQPR